MDYAAFKASLDAYKGPVMDVLPPEFENYMREMVSFSIPATGRSYDVEVEEDGYHFLSPGGNDQNFEEVMSFKNMPAVMSDSFHQLGELAQAARESFPDMTPEQRTECCEQLKNYWQSATMKSSSNDMVYFESAFEDAMSGVGPMQESFLDYIRAGSEMYGQYYADNCSSENVQELAGNFEKAAEVSAYKFMELYDKGFDGLPQSESDVLLTLKERLRYRCDGRVAEAGFYAAYSEAGGGSPLADNSGVELHDFGLSFPEGVYPVSPVLDADMPGVARFELTEVRDSCGRDLREKARELGLEPNTVYGQLMNRIEDYRGPRAIVEPSETEDFMHDNFKGIDACVYFSNRHLQYMYEPDELYPDRPMVGPYNERSAERSVVPMDVLGMNDDDKAVRVEEFSTLRDIVRTAREGYGRMSQDEALEVCNAINLMWQGNTLDGLGKNDGHGRGFDTIQAGITPLQKNFLSYVEAGCDAFVAYYDDSVSREETLSKLRDFAKVSNGCMAFIAVGYDALPDLTDYESKAVFDFVRSVNERAKERVYVESAEDMPVLGISSIDLDIPVPPHMFVPELNEPACKIIEHVPEFGEFEPFEPDALEPDELEPDELESDGIEPVESAESKPSSFESGDLVADAAAAGLFELDSAESGVFELGESAESKPGQAGGSARDIRDLEYAADDVAGLLDGPDSEFDY